MLDELFGDDEGDEFGDAAPLRRPSACGVLKFHSPAAEEGLFVHLEQLNGKECRNNPEATLRMVDLYASTKHWLMCIGPEKGGILEREALVPLVATSTDGVLVLVELGSYLGYSAVHMASTLLRLGVARDRIRVVSIEGDPMCVQWTRRLVDFCGLGDLVTVLPSSQGHAAALEQHLAEVSPQRRVVDLLLIDHDKALYQRDLAAFEAAGLLRPGSIVAADNVLSFNKPLSVYLDHVRDPQRYGSSRLFMASIEYADAAGTTDAGAEGLPSEDLDGMEISVYGGGSTDIRSAPEHL